MLIAGLDYAAGPHLSFGVLYLFPVAFCAWWGGFPPGVLVALASTLAWYLIDDIEHPLIPLASGVCNGLVRFGTLTFASSFISRLHVEVLRERRLARTDALTGAANRRTFHEAVAAEADRARRTGKPLTLVYLDLDDFKLLNDRLGHAAGDAALRHFVQTIQLHLRRSDLLARLGGDEFALLLPEAEAEGVAALLARLQQMLSPEMARQGWPLTLSIGAVTFLRPAGEVDRMVQRTDAVMYEAKQKGKGQIAHAVVQDARERPPAEGRPADRRASERTPCNRPARVRREGRGAVQEEFAMLRDLSAEGVGLHLRERFPPDTVLVVEPPRPEARALLARVVRVVEEERGWIHGCVLSDRLGPEAFRGWLAS